MSINGEWCKIVRHVRETGSTLIVIGVILSTVGLMIKSAADDEYVTREELGDVDEYVVKKDLKPLKRDVQFTLRLILEQSLARLDSRIRVIESFEDLTGEQRRTLSELQLKRRQLRQRLSSIDEQ